MKLLAIQRGGASRWATRAFACLAVAAAAVALTLALAERSSAASLPGPTSFSTGVVDDPAFLNSGDAARTVWLKRARQIGSTSVRIGVVWSGIAPFDLPPGFVASNPSDPNYQWANLDATVRAAAADGQSVLLTVAHAPVWAEAPNRPSYVVRGAWYPSPRGLAAFGHALALRYSGHFPDPLNPGRMLPRVTQFQAWNEPNLPEYLMPQWVRSSNGAILPASPDIYRSLLNAFYAAVKQVQPHSFLLAAGTAPYGDPPGVRRMAPLVFLRAMFCLTASLRSKPCSDPPHFDALDHHPYAVGPTIKARIPDDVSVPDLGKIGRVLRAAQRAGHALPAGPKPLWITEVAWSTNPPDAFTEARQARKLAQGFYELWAQGVDHAFWFQLRDPVGEHDSFAGAGLYLANGVAKPSATAFRFPFVALPVAHRQDLVLWGRAPSAGRVVIEKRVRGRWRPLLHLRTTAGGIFYADRRLGSRLELRARLGGTASLAWATNGSG